jgi:hypothetical protein
MSIEPIGLLTFVIGLICLQLGYRATAATLVVATLLGSAAAILIGTANIPPAQVLLAFLATITLKRRLEGTRTIQAMSFPEPGFWLMCLVIYGLLSGFLMPRLMEGSMPIIPLGTSEYANTGFTVPLGPVSGNLTQGIYLVADFACFIMIVAIASTQAGFATIASALVAYAAGNVLFAVLDLGTFATGTQWLLDFIRNAQYTLHIEEQIGGLKRIVGSFTEASSFARSTLGALGFTGTLWLCGYRPALTGTLALASLALVVLSTSSTGLAGAPAVLLILYVTALMRLGFHPSRPFRSAAVMCAPLLVVAVILAAQLDDEAAKPIRDYIDVLIFNKSATDSGIERNSWNTFALQNFLDSYGLGVGLGTVRTSSFPIALLSNVGVPGTIFYLLFAASAFLRRRGTPRTFPADVRLAARNACLGLIVGDTFAATTLEQGLFFFVLAGIACAEPERDVAALSPAAGQPVGARA